MVLKIYFFEVFGPIPGAAPATPRQAAPATRTDGRTDDRTDEDGRSDEDGRGRTEGRSGLYEITCSIA